MQNDRLPHEFYSKLNINNHFKGCIFKDQIGKGKVNTSTQNGSYSTIENNIVYIPFALKDTEGPSGCIDTSSNDISLEITHPPIVGSDTYSFKLYLIYHTIMTVKNDNINYDGISSITISVDDPVEASKSWIKALDIKQNNTNNKQYIP